MPKTVEATVREYYRIVGDLHAPEAFFTAIVAPGATFTEHPNLISPQGAVRTVAETVAGLRAGRALLSEQTIEVVEVLVAGDRAAIRATWSGTVGQARGPFAVGTRLGCVMAAFATVRDGLIVDHETYDCYPPFGGDVATTPDSADR